jgi:hypothetical protein
MWVSRVVEAPAAHVWRVLIDTTTWTSWGPSVSEVRHQGRFLGPGSHGPTGGRTWPLLPGPRKRPAWRTSLTEGPQLVHVVVSISTRHTCAAGASTTRETHIEATVS